MCIRGRTQAATPGVLCDSLRLQRNILTRQSGNTVYCQKQVSSLCGQHCINNLVQGSSYSAPDLADIAHELDAQERQHMLSEGANTPDALRFLAEESGNVDAAGNFSIQVLNTALKRLYGLHLVSAGSESVGGKMNTTGNGVEEAFVLNRHAHWVTIRSIGGVYWDLNSTLDYPSRITTFALEATLHQLRNDGYSVFVVRGKELPAPASAPGEGARDCWYRVKDLLEASRGAKSSGGTLPTAATDVWLNSGPGQRLDGQAATNSAGGGGGGFGVGLGSGMGSEDAEMARAIRASMEQGGGGEQKGGDPAEDEEDAEMEMARAISLSLEREQPSPTDCYSPRPVPEVQPTGPDVVRVQLRVGDRKKVVHSFKKSDPVTALLDVAAHALADLDGEPVTAPFDLIAPGGQPLLKAGRFVATNGSAGPGEGSTIESEKLGGASVLVRRTR